MAPKIGFVAPVIKAAIATLQANLPGQIAIFNAEAGNVTLAVPVAYKFGADDPLGVGGFPVVEVLAMQGKAGNSSEGLGQAGSDFDHYPTLNVVVWHEGDRGELPTTYEMSLGMARCVIECLLPQGALGGNAQVAEDSGQPVFSWRTDALPANITSDGRQFKKWRVPVFLQFGVAMIDSFS